MNELAAAPLAAAGTEGSVFAMFLSASLVVKFVMIGLLVRLGVVLGDHHQQDPGHSPRPRRDG